MSWDWRGLSWNRCCRGGRKRVRCGRAECETAHLLSTVWAQLALGSRRRFAPKQKCPLAAPRRIALLYRQGQLLSEFVHRELHPGRYIYVTAPAFSPPVWQTCIYSTFFLAQHSPLPSKQRFAQLLPNTEMQNPSRLSTDVLCTMRKMESSFGRVHRRRSHLERRVAHDHILLWLVLLAPLGQEGGDLRFQLDV
jgi:hypothetical protein